GDDTLDGGAGTDSLFGGEGDDTYLVDDLYDVTREMPDEGTDTVISLAAFYYLDFDVENLTLVGAALDGVGNDGDNVITGNDLGNSFFGWDGNDTIDGGAGVDFMSGDEGDDN